MTNQQLTPKSTALLAPHLDYILLDGSGSMSGKWDETLSSLELYRSSLQQSNSHLILSTFSSGLPPKIAHDSLARDAAGLRPLCEFGGTALFDAINSMGRHIKDLNPTQATVLIITDGLENGSQHTTLEQAKSILDWLRAKGYQVIFLGCDFNNKNQAKLLGASEDTAIGVQKALLSDATKNLARKRADYLLYGTPIHFTESEQTQFGGLLPKPSEGA